MPIYQESGLQITLPDGNSFCFQDCAGYQSIKGKKLSEIDFCWWDNIKNILWLLEIKDYSQLYIEEKLPEHLLSNLANKVTDSLLILSAVWCGSKKGQEISEELPNTCCTFPTRLKIVLVLKITNPHLKVEELKALKDKLSANLAGRLALFDVTNVTLIDHETAIKMLTDKGGIKISMLTT